MRLNSIVGTFGFGIFDFETFDFETSVLKESAHEWDLGINALLAFLNCF